MRANKVLLILAAGVSVVILGLLLRQIFTGHWILSQGFSIGPVMVRYYGICLALAALAGYWMAMRRTRVYRIKAEQVDQMFFWLVIVAFIGARLYHVISSWGYYASHPLEVIMVWHGGLSIYGVLIAGFLGILYLARRPSFKSIGLGRILDFSAAAIVIGQVVGRFGNLFNYELMGYPTSLSWKMFVPENFRPLGYEQHAYYHPLFLYEAIGNTLILIWLLCLERKNSLSGGQKYQPGTLFLWYLFLYNILRFFLEFLRIQSTYAGTIRINALVSLVLAAASLGLMIFRHVANNRKVPQN